MNVTKHTFFCNRQNQVAGKKNAFFKSRFCYWFFKKRTFLIINVLIKWQKIT